MSDTPTTPEASETPETSAEDDRIMADPSLIGHPAARYMALRTFTQSLELRARQAEKEREELMEMLEGLLSAGFTSSATGYYHVQNSAVIRAKSLLSRIKPKK